MNLINDTRFALDYAGSNFKETPVNLPDLNSESIPEFLTKQYKLPTERIRAYGKDPIPNINLYGRPDINLPWVAVKKTIPSLQLKAALLSLIIFVVVKKNGADSLIDTNKKWIN